MRKPENRELGRVQYWEGQMLRSSDFLDIQRIEAQRRWWHNRALHKAFGVYQGMTASADYALQIIEVSPGVAYDCFGRELVLECSARFLFPPAPPSDGEVTLLARYREMERRDAADDKAAVCCLAAGQSSVGTVEFVWTSKLRVLPVEGVPLGKLPYVGRKPLRFRPFVAAPAHRPLARPRLGSGSTVPGNTAWQPWVYMGLDPNERPVPSQIGVQTTIDTSAAGFTEVPQYFAWLEGSIWNGQARQLVPALLPSLTDESINSFTFQLILLPPPPPSGNVIALVRSGRAVAAPQIHLIQDSNEFAVFAQQQKLYVAWLGCQMPPKTQFVAQKKTFCSKVFQPEFVPCKAW
jgi:hypothetical protein